MEWLNSITGEVVEVVRETETTKELNTHMVLDNEYFHQVYRCMGGKVKFLLSTKHMSGRWTSHMHTYNLEAHETAEQFIETFKGVLQESLHDKYGETMIRQFRLHRLWDITGDRVIEVHADIKRDTV